MNLQLNTHLSNIDRGAKVLNANVLKWIALITMLIDHIGAGILERGFVQTDSTAMEVDVILRGIGRIAFPLYCFLLVEGYKHTSSKSRYIINMLLFGLISEIPFDYCFFGRIYLQYQNVFFTLLLGVLVIALCDWLEHYDIPCLIGFEVMAFVVMAEFAEILKPDYSWKGIILIAILYLTREMRWLQCLCGAAFFVGFEYTSIVSFALMFMYDGTRQKGINKYVFYAIYPVHLMIYYFIYRLIYTLVFG